jgi:hypothetical protein
LPGCGVRISIRFCFVAEHSKMRFLHKTNFYFLSRRLIHRVTFIKLKTSIKHIKRSMNLELKDIFDFFIYLSALSVTFFILDWLRVWYFSRFHLLMCLCILPHPSVSLRERQMDPRDVTPHRSVSFPSPQPVIRF